MAIEQVLPTLAEYFGKKLIDRLTKDNPREEAVRTRQERVEDALVSHLQKVINWSSQVQFFRMPSARDVERETIPLNFSSTPRRYRKTGKAYDTVPERDLLNARHVLVLGYPGAGKTTTLKRLCRLLLTEDSCCQRD